MNFLLLQIRRIIISSSIFITLLAYLFILFTVSDNDLQVTELAKIFALLSIFYLYLALLPSPLYDLFPKFPLRGLFLKGRRAIGFSAWFFAEIHSCLIFFGKLKGFSGLLFLNNYYLLAIGVGAISLFILTILAFTSFDFMIAMLTFKKWKFLHRFVYLASILIIIHVLMIGEHFSNLSNPISQLSIFAAIILLFLEAIRLNKYLNTK